MSTLLWLSKKLIDKIGNQINQAIRTSEGKKNFNSVTYDITTKLVIVVHELWREK